MLWLGQFGTHLKDSNFLIYFWAIFICQCLGVFFYFLFQQNNLTLVISDNPWKAQMLLSSFRYLYKADVLLPLSSSPDALCEFPVICCWSCPSHSSHNSHAFAHHTHHYSKHIFVPAFTKYLHCPLTDLIVLMFWKAPIVVKRML